MIIEELCLAPILAVPNFDILLEVEFDYTGVDIRVVLTQVKHSLAYFDEKLSGPKLNHPTYEKEIDTMIQALTYGNHYINPKPFIIHSYHKALSYLN